MTKNSMTPEKYHLIMAQTMSNAQDKISACQVQIAKNIEKQTEVDLEKTLYEMQISRKIADRSLHQSSNFLRPSFVLRPSLRRSVEGWMAEYGELTAFGETPEIAFQEFDDRWVGKDGP